MRILYVLNSLAMGGTERQVLAIARRMAQRGHAVKLMVLRPRQPEGCATDLDVVYLDMEKSIASLFAGLRRGHALVQEFKPDVLHSHNFHGNMLARLTQIFNGRSKLISTIHNVYEGGRLRMLAYRLTDGMAYVTTAVANAVAERYVRLRAVPGSKCVVVTNGIEMAELQPNAQRRAAIREDMGVSDEFVWLSVGRITPAKDFPNLMQAFGQALRDFPKVQLWIVGDGTAGSGEAAYSSAVMLQRASIPGPKILTWGTQVSSISSTTLEKVRWLGLRRDVPALLDAADGFVLSSAWEGMPLALGEAMAMEKPVVATDVGGVRELVGDAGVIVPAKDSGALAAAMLDVMKRPSEWRAATGRAARARIAESFSMDAKADQWEALYRSVAE